jgi:hypothetical protein
MADAPPAAEAKGSTFGFLGHKVAGKIPVWVIAVAAVGGWYWYKNYGPGKSSSTVPAGVMTDPAGNQCAAINPDTGYCPGTPEDTAALAANAAAGGASTSGTDTTGAAAGGGNGGTTGGGGTSGGGGTTGDGTTYVPPATSGTTSPAAAATTTATNPTGADIPVAFPGVTPVSKASVAAAQHKAHLAHEAHLAHVQHVNATKKKPPVRGKK